MATRPRVVIVGAGFGGLAAAKELADAPVDVVLVDRHNYHTFQPLLYQVATAGLSAADVAHPVRNIFQRQRNLDFRQATVTGCDWRERALCTDDTDGHERRLPFDHLIVAAGATTTFFGIDGAAAHAYPLYNLADAVALRNHILQRFEAAAAEPSLIDDGALTFVVAGGGPTGVETAGALAELFHQVLRYDFRTLDVARARVVLLEMTDHLLAAFQPREREYAVDALRRRGVEVRLGEAVTLVGPTTVELQSGQVVPAHTLVWAAGVQANPVVAALGVPTGKSGRISVGADLRIEGHREAFAVGDVAAIHPGGRSQDVLPQLAPVAMQSGRHAAEQVQRLLDDRPTQAFDYTDKGIMATIGRRAAVAELPLRINLRGTPAWMAWLGLHLVFLVGFRNRVSVFVNWAWNYLTWDRGPRLILHAAPEPTPPSERET